MEKIKFRDRISKYPNRKKLKIISQNENEIVAEVTPADEAQVEGVELNAKILNKWQDVISTSEDNAMLAKNKVHIAEDNAKLAVKYSKEAISKAEQAEMVAEFVSKSVNNTFIPIKTSELYNDNQFISAKEQSLTDEEKLQARENIGAGTSNFSGDYEDLINKPYIPSYDNVPTKDYIDEKLSDLVNSAPETLDTLGEIASALEENEDVISALNSVVSNKVDKVAGKGLSTNDFTNEDKTNLEENSLARHSHTNKSILDSTTANFTTQEKTKLSGIEVGAEVNNPIDSTLSTTSENAVQNKVVTEALNNKTTVNISSVTQNTINFTSDPQTQLNEKLDKSGGEVSGDVTINNGNGIVLEPSSAGQTYNAFKFYAQGDDVYVEKQKVEGGADYQKILPLDSELSLTSINAVQNNVVTEALNDKASLSQNNTFTGNQSFTGDVNIKSLKQSDDFVWGTLYGNGAPTTTTVGAVGQLYIDITNDKMYVCVQLNFPNYVWKEVAFIDNANSYVLDYSSSTTPNATWVGIAYDFDFNNYDYLIEYKNIANNSDGDHWGFINSNFNWLYMSMRWVSLRAKSSTTGSQNLSPEGWAFVNDNVDNVYGLDSVGNSNREIYAQIKLTKFSNGNYIHFRYWADSSYSGTLQEFINSGQIYGDNISNISGIYINRSGNITSSEVKIFRRKR